MSVEVVVEVIQIRATSRSPKATVSTLLRLCIKRFPSKSVGTGLRTNGQCLIYRGFSEEAISSRVYGGRFSTLPVPNR